eukprot:12147049-Alexandrium_andersonii.AAC.1
MARLHLGGMSASGAETLQCLICGAEGLGIGIQCEFCGACVDQPTLEPHEEEQLGQARTLTDRTALHLVRPLGSETNPGNTEAQGSLEQDVATGD